MGEELKEVGEFGFIERIKGYSLVRPQGVIKGIGDDASVFEAPSGKVMVLTTDMLVEGVHFLPQTDPFSVGKKAICVNLSDIAAMGAEPMDAYISVAVPKRFSLRDLEDLYRGINEAASLFSVNLLGGDTTVSPGPLVINVSMTGSAPREEILYRSGAKPGDFLYVTGYLGEARAGLDLLSQERKWQENKARRLLDAHLRPTPHIREGRLFATSGFASAMMDVSDGIASDLGHICGESQVGAIVREEWLPISQILYDYCKDFGLDPIEIALGGGEDYCLLATVRPYGCETLEEAFARQLGKRIWKIGWVTEDKRILLVRKSGEVMPLPVSGWDSFRCWG